MHQSSKHKIINSPDNQLQHAVFAEAISRASVLNDVEASSEFTSVQEKLKNVTKKSYR